MAEATAKDLDALRRALLLRNGEMDSLRLDTFYLPLGSLLLLEEPRYNAEKQSTTEGTVPARISLEQGRRRFLSCAVLPGTCV